jgi:hypothetical protein
MARAPSLLAFATLAAMAACRFERRAEPSAAGDSVSDSTATVSVEDSVRSVLNAVEAALAAGDVARVSRLTVSGATLIDQEDAVAWSRGDPAAPLPRALLSRTDSLSWELESSRFTPVGVGSNAALVVNEYHATSGPNNWNAVETLLVVRTTNGWRLQHLHRSRGLKAGEL